MAKHLGASEHNHKIRDVLFLDLALEGYSKTLADRIVHIDIGLEAYVREVGIILGNLLKSYSWSELENCHKDWLYASSILNKLDE